MAIQCTPIRVRIGLKPNGHALYPDWNKLPLARLERPEDHQIVKWIYDKQSGHNDESAGSPRGTQLGVMLVTPQYAAEAVETFPGVVQIIDEPTLEAFWNTRAFAHLSDVSHQSGVLEDLKAEYELRKIFQIEGVGESGDQDVSGVLQQMLRALNKDDPEPGIRRNAKRRWVKFKAKMDLEIV